MAVRTVVLRAAAARVLQEAEEEGGVRAELQLECWGKEVELGA